MDYNIGQVMYKINYARCSKRAGFPILESSKATTDTLGH